VKASSIGAPPALPSIGKLTNFYIGNGVEISHNAASAFLLL
jgi:hypothetical protein